ncbi:YeiH family protein [Ammoniphilus sp. YIM 78166]|uniref:YeiH family protein n=1 Tax=Ammoniphilus sp. YIM 78166 TaxID=1644106 RepID=UPI001431B101|nr:putative sulfate exporter family transporter [Ammoniphilus sp. YIM 78166]
METSPLTGWYKIINIGLYKGVALTLLLAYIAYYLATMPLLSSVGAMVLSILMGVCWKVALDVPPHWQEGVQLSSKGLLRFGIILLGFRLDPDHILSVGSSVFIMDLVIIVGTLSIMIPLGRRLSVERDLTLLLSVGTAICGAAAIAAIAPLIRVKNESVALSVACIAILGTLGTVVYTVLFPLLNLNAYYFGVFAGLTLQEVAHVIAASAVGGTQSSDVAIITKLGRVLLLIPVAMVFSKRYSAEGKKQPHSMPIPWFILGFAGCSVLNMTGIVPDIIVERLTLLGSLALCMAMAGLGLSVELKNAARVGGKALLLGLLGFAAIIVMGASLVILSYFSGNF